MRKSPYIFAIRSRKHDTLNSHYIKTYKGPGNLSTVNLNVCEQSKSSDAVYIRFFTKRRDVFGQERKKPICKYDIEYCIINKI